MTYRQESRLVLATSGLKLLGGYEIGAGPGISDQFGHSLASIEIRDCANNRFTFCLRTGETDRIQKLVLWNINGRLHASRLTLVGLLTQDIPMMDQFRAKVLGMTPRVKRNGRSLNETGYPVVWRSEFPTFEIVDVSNALAQSCWMLSVRVALPETIWYVPMMQPKSLPADSATDINVETSDRRLSVIHAGALYRPVPHVELDDDGFVYKEGRVSESTRHGESLAYGLLRRSVGLLGR